MNFQDRIVRRAIKIEFERLNVHQRIQALALTTNNKERHIYDCLIPGVRNMNNETFYGYLNELLMELVSE